MDSWRAGWDSSRFPPPMKVCLKTPTLDLEINDVKNLEEVLEFIAGLKKLETETAKPNREKQSPKKK